MMVIKWLCFDLLLVVVYMRTENVACQQFSLLRVFAVGGMYNFIGYIMKKKKKIYQIGDNEKIIWNLLYYILGKSKSLGQF